MMKFIELWTTMSIKINRFFLNKGKEKDHCLLCFGLLEKNPWYSEEYGNLICRHCAFAERARIRNNNKRKRNKKNSNGKVYFSEWMNVLKQYNFSCAECGRKNRKILTIDHIIPLASGGNNKYSNIQPLCTSCHEEKDGYKPTFFSIKNRYTKKLKKFLWEKFGFSFKKKLK